MASERILLPSPVSVGGRSVIASPFQFATAGEDLLRVRFWWFFDWPDVAVTTQAVTLQVRSVDSNGALQVGATTYTLVGAFGSMTQYYPLAAGYLQTVALVWAGSASFNVGPVYAVVDFVRGTQAGANTPIGQLLGGYVERGQSLCWPGSEVRGPLDGPGYPSSEQTGALFGSEVTWTPPAGTLVRVRSFSGGFATSALPGNRYPALTVSDQSGPLGVYCPGVLAVPASSGMRFSWAPGAGAVVGASGLHCLMSMPDVRLHYTESLVTATAGFLAGDHWLDCHVRYDMWLEALP